MAANSVRVNMVAATSSGVTTDGAIALGFYATGNSSVGVVPLSSVGALNLPALPVGVYPPQAYTVTSGTLYIVEVLP